MMRLGPSIAVLVALLLVAPAARAADDPQDDEFREQVAPFVERYCVRCHAGEKAKGAIDLAAFTGADSVRRERKLWEAVAEQVEAGIMPPDGEMPDEPEINRLIAWIQATTSQADCDLTQPGRVTLRRLNRAEYNNTVRDLLGVEFRPADDFPHDDVGYGFDNIGDVLTLPPLLMEKYLDAAEKIAAAAIAVPRIDPGGSIGRTGKDLQGGGEFGESARMLATNGALSTVLDLPGTGRYVIRVRAVGEQAGDEPPRMSLKVDGRELAVFDVSATDRPDVHEASVELEAGERRLEVAFLNDFYDPEAADPARRDRNLIVHGVELIGPASPPLWPIREFRARELRGGGGDGRRIRTLASSGEITADLNVPADGLYRLAIRAYGDQAGREPCRMGVRIDGQEHAIVDVPATDAEPGLYTVAVDLKQGRRKVALAFLNDYYQPDAPDPQDRGDRNLHILGLEVLGTEPANLPEAHRRIIAHRPEPGADWREPARETLREFMTRAYRRPVRTDEADRFVRLVELVREEGDSYEAGIRLAVTAVLVNPNFLFRVELDRRSGRPDADAKLRPLTDWELASRLSYFLWSSMPDDALFALAREGKLQDDRVLEEQARRMLRDPRSSALVENFATQWLTLRAVSNINPDPRLFRRFNDRLRDAMVKETELFFASIVEEDRDILDLLDADYTYLNEALARHYGIEGVEGEEFRRVDLPAESPRGGVLTQASILTITSNPTRTSPVKRGKWILEQILGTPPPPPPPDVPELEDGEQLKGTLRQRMEQHRENPSCAICHNKLDPLGFGFENFDAIGRWRDRDGDDPIDASGALPTGESFAGVEELKQMLKNERADQFTRNLAEKLLTYGLGRGLEYYDACAVDAILAAAQADGRKFSRLVVEVVKSEPFRKRSLEGGPTQ